MRREGVLERSWEQGWHPGWASWERSELSRILAVTENPSNKTLCTSLRHCLVCAHPLLRSHTAVQESTWEEEAALVGSHGSVFQQDLTQFLACLPVATSVLPVWWYTTGKEGMLGGDSPSPYERRAASVGPGCPDAVFPSPALPWGAGPVCARSVSLSLLADISPFLSLNPRDVPFRQRSLLGEQGTPLTQAPLGSWSFN